MTFQEPIRVLHVDDDRLDRELVAHALSVGPGRFVLDEAATKGELRNRLQEGGYDVILTDFRVLGFDGFEVIDLVWKKLPGVPVIIVTGTGSEEIAVEAMRRGVSDYVIKSPKHIKRLPHTIRAAVERKRAENALRALATELSMTEERERRRFASDLHDSIGQSLALAQIKLADLEATAPTPERARALGETRDVIRRSLHAVRSLSFQLSPPVLSELGLAPALEWLVDQLRREHGLAVRLRADRSWRPEEPPDEALRQFLFRAVRELLMNVVRHSGVRSAVLSLRKRKGKLQLTVADSGVGFDASSIESSSGFGLLHVRERVRHHGGALFVESEEGKGTRVTIELSTNAPSRSRASKGRARR